MMSHVAEGGAPIPPQLLVERMRVGSPG